MIFSSWLFASFFLVVFTVYWTLKTRRARHVLLLLASYFFYMSWNPWLVTLIIGSTVLDYLVGMSLMKTKTARRRTGLLILSLVGNLGILAIFKYADFFILSMRGLLTSLGLQANMSTLSIILPVGISFYTFQTMSYTIDIYRGKLTPTRSFLDFALFVAFFPQLVAGPIVKARDFLPQLETLKKFSWEHLDTAVVLFMIGLTKKVLIADQLAYLVDPVFADPTRFVTRDLWLAMFCYGGQIYCDFSGYTDMAIAVALMLGFTLRPNFASPYLATSLTDFWHRWHISLSTWLRDYLYKPLGGGRGGTFATYRNLFLTMVLGGIWHGAAWTFVIWGFIHGTALAVERLVVSLRTVTAPVMAVAGFGPGTMAPAGRPREGGMMSRALGVFVTFNIVCLAWIFFRAENFETALAYLQGLTDWSGPVRFTTPFLVFMVAGSLGAHFVPGDLVTRAAKALEPVGPIGLGFLLGFGILLIESVGPEGVAPFIYFQF